jgi:flagellar motility protein MotE (MotC chaperone)
MIQPVAQGLSSAATVAGIIAAIVGTVVGVLTFRATWKGARGSDLERLQGTLSKWSQDTIADLRADLQQEEQRRHAEVQQSEARCRTMVEQLRAEFETRVAEERARAEWWKARAQGEPDDPSRTPPPDAREGT